MITELSINGTIDVYTQQNGNSNTTAYDNGNDQQRPEITTPEIVTQSMITNSTTDKPPKASNSNIAVDDKGNDQKPAIDKDDEKDDAEEDEEDDDGI